MSHSEYDDGAPALPAIHTELALRDEAHTVIPGQAPSRQTTFDTQSPNQLKPEPSAIDRTIRKGSRDI